MQLTVVVENQTSSQSLLAEWGYSAWLQTEDAVILLDTGGIQHTLQHNLTALGLNARRITDLVLSHGHFDHTSGVMDVLRLAPHARVWAAPGIGRERLGDADAKRASGGGSMLAGLAFSPIDPFVEIAPGVTAFTVPATERDPRWRNRARHVCRRRLAFGADRKRRVRTFGLRARRTSQYSALRLSYFRNRSFPYRARRHASERCCSC